MLQVLKLREVIYEKSRGERLERYGAGEHSSIILFGCKQFMELKDINIVSSNVNVQTQHRPNQNIL
jgi:hypothetical protein